MRKIISFIAIFIFLINYLSAQSVQNGDFENWQMKNYYSYPNSWYTIDNLIYADSLAQKVNDGHEGSYSIRLNTKALPNGTSFGVTLYGSANNGKYKGNSYSQLGDSLHFWYKANIQSGDYGMVLLMLYKNGNLLDSIHSFFYGTQDSWKQVALPVNPSQTQPDSMFLAFLSSIPQNLGGNPIVGSWLMIDDIYFTSRSNTTPIVVPNYSFEDWTTTKSEEPDYWQSTNARNTMLNIDTANVIKTTDTHTGSYAARLSVIDIQGETLSGKLTYTQPFTYQPEKMSFYYKYFPSGADTAEISVEFIKNNANVGGASYKFINPTNNYAEVLLDLTYNEVPDQLIIRVETGTNNGSVLYIDDIKFFCSKPKYFFGEFVSFDAAHLNWVPGGTEDEWHIEWGLQGFSLGAGNLINVNNQTNYTLNSLNDANNYDFYIKGVCNIGDSSTWAGPFTLCKSENIPISLNFENVPSGEIPGCWNRIVSGSASVKTDNAGNANNGSRYLSININTDQTAIFSSPEITDALSGLFVSFYAKKANWSTHATVIIGSMSNPSDPNSFNELTTFVLSNNYQNYTFYLNNYIGSDKYIGFKIATNDWHTETYLDDILIDLAPTCIPTHSLMADNITASSSTISWHAGGNETLWTLNYGPKGFNPDSSGTSVSGLTLPTYNLSALSSGNTYDVYVQADCGSGDLSTRTKISFTTLCMPFNVPLIEDFDNVNPNEIPNCWKSISTAGSSVLVISTGQSTSGQNSIRMNWNNSICNTMLITPQMINPLNQLFISFKAKTSGANLINISVGTMSNPNDENSFTPLKNFQLTTSFESYIYYLNNYSGSNAYLALKVSSNQNVNTDVFVDDFFIGLLPSCIPPNTLSVQNITAHSAQVSWQAGNNETHWNLIYGNTGFNPNIEGTIVSGLTTTTYNFNNTLNYGSSYDVYVLADCGSGNLSSWINKTFTTLCQPLTVPSLQDFESVMIPDIPNCWHKFTTDSAYVETVNSGQSTSGTNSVMMETSHQGIAYLITSDIVQNINALEISFYAKVLIGNSPSPLILGTMTNPSDTSTFHELTIFNLNNTFQHYISYLNNYAGTDHYLALKSGASVINTQIFIDDILIDSLPSCVPPNTLQVHNIMAHSAQLSWHAGNNETHWNLKYGETGFNPITQGTYIHGLTTTSYDFNNTLNSGTSYEVYLLADCGSGDSSIVITKSFTTLCIPYAVPFTEGFENAVTPAIPNCWYKLATSNELVETENTGDAHSGLKNIVMHVQQQDTAILITPQLITDINALYIQMYLKKQSGSGLASVVLGTITNPADKNTFTPITQIDLTTNYQPFIHYFNNYSGTDNYMALKLSTTDVNARIFVDDILIDSLPGCIPPNSLMAHDITSNSAQLSWQAGNNEALWNIIYGETGFNPALEGVHVDSIATTAYNFNDSLISGVTYDVYLRAYCGLGDSSIWVGPYQFSTICNVAIAPLVETFEGLRFPPVCWKKENGSGDWMRTMGVGGFGNSSHCAYANFYTITGSNPFDLITFEFDASGLNNPQLIFDYAYAMYSQTRSDQLDIYSSANSGTSYALLQAMTGSGILNTAGTDTVDFVPSSGQWAKTEMSLPAGTNKVKFTATSGHGNNLYIDNVIICNKYEIAETHNICSGDSSLWRGHYYAISGIYYDSLKTVLGCDSIYVLNLNVHNPFESVVDKTICNGDFFSWQGNNYYTAGTYYDSLQSIFGCDSIYILHLFVNPVYEFDSTATICAGDTFIWRGNNHITAGVYYDSLQTITNCDSLFVLNLNVNPAYHLVTDKNICAGEVFNWRGNDYSATGLYYDSLQTALGCDSIYILNLKVNPLPTITINGLDNSYCNNNVAVVISGLPLGGSFTGVGISGNTFSPAVAGTGIWHIIYVANDTNNCLNSDSVSVAVNQTYLFSHYDTICDGSIFIWHGHNYLSEGLYYDSLQTAKGCDSIYVLHLKVNPVYEFELYQTICEGSSFLWRGSSYNLAGNYYDTLQTVSGCDSIYALYLSITPVSVGGTLSAVTTTICINTSTGTLTLSGQTGTVVHWEKRLNNGVWSVIPCSLTVYSEILTTPGIWEFRVLVQNSTCSSAYSSILSIIVVSEASVASVTGTSPICVGALTDYTANSVVLNGGTGTWSSSNNSIATVNSSGLINGVAAGTCDIIYTITGGCGGTKTAFKTITVSPNLHATVSISASANPVCAGTPVTFTAAPVNGGTTPVFLWKVNGNSTGINGAVFTTNSLINGDVVSCQMTANATPCLTGSPAVSNSIAMTIRHAYNIVQNGTTCNGSIYSWRGHNYTSAGTYYDSLLTALGCDSIYVLHLNVNQVYEFTNNQVICNGDFLFWRGHNYSTAGTYYDSLLSVKGCDSIYKLTLSVTTVDVSVTQNGPVLTAHATGAGYQWVDCDHGFANVPNQTLSIFTATSNGNFAVLVVQNGCVDTSACFNVTGVSINDLADKVEIIIKPNPNNGRFAISLSENAEMTVFNNIGEIVYQGYFESGSHDFLLNNLANGVYNFNFRNSHMLINRKVVIQK